MIKQPVPARLAAVCFLLMILGLYTVIHTVATDTFPNHKPFLKQLTIRYIYMNMQYASGSVRDNHIGLVRLLSGMLLLVLFYLKKIFFQNKYN